MGAHGSRPEARLARRGGGVELLRVPAAMFGAVARLRRRLYERGLLPVARLEVPVVSVGNLTTGGTGKTPFVAFVVRAFEARGLRAGVLSRGYGPRAADGTNEEARVLARMLPDTLHEQDPDRVAGGQRLVERGVDAIVLDDGFQHLRLARDLDLVLVDATRPWGLPAPDAGGEAVRALLPRGLLREPPAALERADAVVLTRADQVAPERLAALESELQRLAPGRPVLHAVHRPTTLVAPDGTTLDPTALAGRAVDLVCGLGNPEAFAATVTGLGARVRTTRAFPDHHDFAPGDLDGLGDAETWVVTTAKDAAKLPRDAAVHRLEVEIELVRGAGVLDALLDALPPSANAERVRALHEGLHG
jgi:tetraacyldisaccharide 4'-kinase